MERGVVVSTDRVVVVESGGDGGAFSARKNKWNEEIVNMMKHVV